MALVYFEREGKTLRANSGVNLRKLARANRIQVYHGIDKLINCRGQGLCGTCKMEITAANPWDVNPRTAMEERKLKDFTNPKLRLSCQVIVHGNISVKTQPVELMIPEKENVPPPLVTG